MQPSRDIERLIEIMAALRQPETGCPWDIVQTFETIKPYTIEEAYEVADAIERNDMDDLCEELGDLLLQVVFHARMAEEQHAFAFGDVVEAITAKMIRRHPHVFGTGEERAAGAAPGFWAKIKAEERAAKAAARNETQPPTARGADCRRTRCTAISVRYSARFRRSSRRSSFRSAPPRSASTGRSLHRSSTRSRRRSANCAKRCTTTTRRRSRTNSAT